MLQMQSSLRHATTSSTSRPRAFAPSALAPAPQRRSIRVASASHDVIDDRDAAKLEKLLRAFQMADSDGNGTIDRDELRHLLQSTDSGEEVMFTEHWLPEDELDRVISQYDKDGNGVIDFEEFKQIVYDGLLLDGKLSEYEEAFKAVDSSGNGTIGATELAQLFTTLGNPMTYERLVEVMQKYDKDESGQIEFNEFLMMFRDQLIDLKAVQTYMEENASRPSMPSQQILDIPEGDIVLIFSEKELDEVIEQSNAKGKVVVLFSALTWCRPCKAMQRPTQKLAEAYKDTTTWVKVFGNANSSTKKLFKDRLKIRSTPSFIAFKDGQVVFTRSGNNKEALELGLREALGGEANPALPSTWVYPGAEAQQLAPATA